MLRYLSIPSVLVCTIFIFNSFFTPQPNEAKRSKKNTEYTNTLSDSSSFFSFSGTPLVTKYNGVSSVKLVYDLKRKKLYYINSAYYTYHFDFCEKELGYSGGLALFNQSNYVESSLRQYALANLNYYPTLKRFALEFVSEDNIRAEYVLAMQNAVQNSSFIKKSCGILINGEYLKSQEALLQHQGLIYPNDIYASLEYQAIMPGDAYGKLQFINDSKELFSDQPSAIYVLKGSPIYIPTCQGIITDQFQTPLSHIQILAHNKRIPSFAYKAIWSEKYNTLNQQWVHMRITADSFFIEPVAEEIALKRMRHHTFEAIRLEADKQFNQIQSLAQFKKKDKNKIGNKAANLAILEKLSKESKGLFHTPEGSFAIPFYFYHQHVTDTLIQKQLQRVLSYSGHRDKDILKKELRALRKCIEEKSLDAAFLHLVEKQILNNKAGFSYRFRSSSNAEDAVGFSGAGLYSSKTGILYDSVKTIERAIKKVWASVWSMEAFLAREQAHILQDNVMMAIVCHRNFPTEEANGVVVTKNIYRPSFNGFTVNVQKNELSVVEPDSNIVCDQFTFFKPADFNPFTDDIAVDYITYGNQNGGKPVLSVNQIATLYQAVAACDAYFAENVNSTVAYDLEFKFFQGKLYIKQIRPYY